MDKREQRSNEDFWHGASPRNVLTFQARYTNPSRINVSVFGRMVGKQFDDDQNQFRFGRFFVLDAMALHSIGAGAELFAAFCPRLIRFG